MRSLIALVKQFLRSPRRFLAAVREAAARLEQERQPASGAVAPQPGAVFPDSAVAHHFLDGLKGIEIGGSAHNPFHIEGCMNVDFTDSPTVFTGEQMRMCGDSRQVDVAAPGDDLPFPDASLDYVLSSHVLEHFHDPVRALEEWLRVVRPGGYVFMVIPHRDRTFDHDRSLTSVEELFARHAGPPLSDRQIDAAIHHCVWTTESFLELCAALGLQVVHVDDVDDKVGNGFTVVIRR